MNRPFSLKEAGCGLKLGRIGGKVSSSAWNDLRSSNLGSDLDGSFDDFRLLLLESFGNRRSLEALASMRPMSVVVLAIDSERAEKGPYLEG